MVFQDRVLTTSVEYIYQIGNESDEIRLIVLIDSLSTMRLSWKDAKMRKAFKMAKFLLQYNLGDTHALHIPLFRKLILYLEVHQVV